MNRIYDAAGRQVAKVGFRRGPSLTPEERNGRITMLSASLLTLVAISFGSLGLWRVGTDLEWAGDFVIQDGFLSHWQVWVGAAIRASLPPKCARALLPGTTGEQGVIRVSL